MTEHESNSNMQCERLHSVDLVYHSSEQYLILCLKICNLIIKSRCDIKSLVDFNTFLTSNKTNETNTIHLNKLKTFSANNLFGHDPHSQSISYTTSLFSNLNETECIKYGHKESYKLSLFVFGILLCFVILILNGLTLITIIRSRRLHTITNILIANLSISDFLSGIAFLYPCVLNLLTINALETYNSYLYTIACNIRQYYYVCLAGYSPMITSMLSSMLTLTLLALEKYIAIVKPYMYKRFIHERKYLCYLCLFITWSISITVSLLPMIGWNEHQKYSSYRGFNCKHSKSMPCMFERIFTLSYILLFTSICLVCACTMLAIYTHIYVIARKHSKQIAQIHSILNKKQTHRENTIKNNEPDCEMIVLPPNQLIKATSLLKSSSVSSFSSDEFKIQNSNENEVSQNMAYVDSTNPSHLPDILVKSNSLRHIQINDNNELNSSNQQQQSMSTKPSTSINPFEFIENTAVTTATTKSINHSMKTMKTLLILLLGFYACWLPLIVYFLTFASQKYNNLTIYILMFVACCNAVIDPLVYAFRNREFRKALLLNFKNTKH